MHLTLRQVLEHPTLVAADPVVLAGSAGLDATVRWIHSSDVLDIAPLLRGGELLLTSGELLATAPERDQRRYARELADRRVAGVALEIGPRLPEVPGPMLEEADAAGFPLVALHRVVPFVGIAEAVNSALVNDSVTRLRQSGELAHALSVVLGDGGSVQELVEELAVRTGARVVLRDTTGELVAEAGDNGGEEPPGADVSRTVTLRGALAATLTLAPGPEADPDLLPVAAERAVEALGLALLRSKPPSPRDYAASELVRLASRGPGQTARVARLAQVVGFDADHPVLALAGRGSAGGLSVPGLSELLQGFGRPAVDLAQGEVRCVLSLPDRRRAAVVRARLVEALGPWTRQAEDLTVAVGPVMPTLAGVSDSMEAAAAALDPATPWPPGTVVDANVTAVETLVGGELDERSAQFVRMQLAMLLHQSPATAEPLMETLETYFDTGCNKTRTAELLHLQRQSLYARLERAFVLVGGDPTGTPRALPLHLALRLRHRLRPRA